MLKTNIYINAIDNTTEAFKNISSKTVSVSKNLNDVAKSSKGVKDATKDVDNLNKSVFKLDGNTTNFTKNLTSSVKGGLTSYTMKLAGIAAGLLAVGTAYSSVKGLYSKGLEVSMNESTSSSGIAGLIASLTTIKNEQGGMITGAEKYSAALKLAKEDMKQVSLEAMRTGVNVKELTDAYTQALAPGLSSGMNRSQVLRITTLTANAAKTMGMSGDMIAQEIRALLSGDITSDAQIGKSLELGAGQRNQKAYQKAIEDGKAFEYLMDLMKSFEDAGKDFSNSLAGIFDQSGDIINRFAKDASGSLETALKKLGNPMNTLFNQETGEWNKKIEPLISFLDQIGGMIGNDISNAVDKVTEHVLDFSDSLRKNPEIIKTIEASWDVVKSGFSAGANVIEQIINLTTAVGGKMLDIVTPTEMLNSNLSESERRMQVLQKILGAIEGTFTSIANINFTSAMDVITALFSLKSGDEIVSSMKKPTEFKRSTESYIAEARRKNLTGLEHLIPKEDTRVSLDDNRVRKETRGGINYAMILSGDDAKKFDEQQALIQKQEMEQRKNQEKRRKLQEEFDKENKKGNKKRQNELLRELKEQEREEERLRKEGIRDAKRAQKEHESDLKNTFDLELNSIQSFYEKEKDLQEFSRKELDFEREFNLISLVEYFKKKNTLNEESNKLELESIDKQLEAVKKAQSITVNKNQLVNLQKTENDLLVQREKMNSEFTLNNKKNLLQQEKDQREHLKVISDLQVQVFNASGNKIGANNLTFNNKFSDLKEQYKNEGDILEQISKLEQLEQVQLRVNNINTAFNDILDLQKSKEELITVNREIGNISELEMMQQISDIRKENVNILQEEIDKLSEIYKLTNNPEILKTMFGLQAQMIKVKDSTDLVANKFNDLFKDGMSDVFYTMMTDIDNVGNSFKNLAKTIEAEMARLVANKAFGELASLLGLDTKNENSIGGLLSKAIGGGSKSSTPSSSGSSGGGGFNIGSLWDSAMSWFGGFFASGGQTNGNKPMIVGESGPEWFFPGKPGYITNAATSRNISNNINNNGGGVTNYNINVQAKDMNSFQNSQGQIAASAISLINSQARRYS